MMGALNRRAFPGFTGPAVRALPVFTSLCEFRQVVRPPLLQLLQIQSVVPPLLSRSGIHSPPTAVVSGDGANHEMQGQRSDTEPDKARTTHTHDSEDVCALLVNPQFIAAQTAAASLNATALRALIDVDLGSASYDSRALVKAVISTFKPMARDPPERKAMHETLLACRKILGKASRTKFKTMSMITPPKGDVDHVWTMLRTLSPTMFDHGLPAFSNDKRARASALADLSSIQYLQCLKAVLSLLSSFWGTLFPSACGDFLDQHVATFLATSPAEGDWSSFHQDFFLPMAETMLANVHITLENTSLLAGDTLVVKHLEAVVPFTSFLDPHDPLDRGRAFHTWMREHVLTSKAKPTLDVSSAEFHAAVQKAMKAQIDTVKSEFTSKIKSITPAGNGGSTGGGGGGGGGSGGGKERNRHGHGSGGGGGTKRPDANTPNARDTKRGRESPDDLDRFLKFWISELRSKGLSKVQCPYERLLRQQKCLRAVACGDTGHKFCHGLDFSDRPTDGMVRSVLASWLKQGNPFPAQFRGILAVYRPQHS